MGDQDAVSSQDSARPPNRVPPAAYAVSPAVQQEVSATLRTLVSETGIDSALVIRLARELRESRAQNQALIASQKQPATPSKDAPAIPLDVAQIQREYENTRNANLELQRALTHLNQRYNDNLMQLEMMRSKVVVLQETVSAQVLHPPGDPQERIKRLELELAQSRIEQGQANQDSEMLRVQNTSLQNQLQLHAGRRASSLPIPTKRPEAQSQLPSPHSAQVQLQRQSSNSHPSPTYLLWRNQPSPHSPLGFYAIQGPITHHPSEVNVRLIENGRRVTSAPQPQAPLQSQQQMQPQAVGQQAQAQQQQQPAQIQQSGSDRTLSYVQQQMQQFQPIPVMSQPPPKKRPQLHVQTQQPTYHQQLQQVYSQNLPQQQHNPVQMQPRQPSLQQQFSPQQNSPLRQAHPMPPQQLQPQQHSQQDTHHAQQKLRQSHQLAESQFLQQRLQQSSQYYRTSASRSFPDPLLPLSAPATLPHYFTSSPVTASLSPASWNRGNTHTATQPVANLQLPPPTPVRFPEDLNVAETATAGKGGLRSHGDAKQDGRASEERMDVIKDLTHEEPTRMEESEPERPTKRRKTEEPEALPHPGPLLETSGGPEVVTGSTKQTGEIRPAAPSSSMNIISQGPAIPQNTAVLPNVDVSMEQPLEASESTHEDIKQYEQEIQMEQQRTVSDPNSHPHFAEIVEVGNIEDNANAQMSNTTPLDHPEIVELLEFSFVGEGVSQRVCAFCRMRHEEDPEGWPTLTMLDRPSTQDMVLHLQEIHTEVWEAVLCGVGGEQGGG